MDEHIASIDRKPSPSTPDIAFGTFVGLFAGAAVGWMCCWLVGEDGFVWNGALLGALIGAITGSILGYRHGRGRHDFVNSEIATTVCTSYPLLLSLLILLAGIGMVRGKFTGLFVLGAACAAPMLGLLIGGMLDRVYERVLRQRQK